MPHYIAKIERDLLLEQFVNQYLSIFKNKGDKSAENSTCTVFQENGNQHVHEHSEFIWFLTDIALDAAVGRHSLIYGLSIVCIFYEKINQIDSRIP